MAIFNLNKLVRQYAKVWAKLTQFAQIVNQLNEGKQAKMQLNANKIGSYRCVVIGNKIFNVILYASL